MDNQYYAKNADHFIKQICRNDILMAKGEGNERPEKRKSQNISSISSVKNYDEKF